MEHTPPLVRRRGDHVVPGRADGGHDGGMLVDPADECANVFSGHPEMGAIPKSGDEEKLGG